MLRVAVIGVGQQGKHHVRFLREMDGVELVLLADTGADRARKVGEEFGFRYTERFETFISEFDAAIVAVPTTDHFKVASELIAAGKHVLIEKPVTNSVEEAVILSDLSTKKGIVAHVGLPERFNPATGKAFPVITKPLFVETHRLGSFSPRSLDIDVVLDLMIHDLDLLYLFLKEEPSDIDSVGIPILSQNIDIANARLKYPGGCVVNLTASRVSGKRMRKMRIFQPYSYISLDFAQQAVSLFSLQPNACAGGFPEIKHLEFQPEHEHPLQNELKAFRDAILSGDTKGVTIADAIPSLKAAIAVKEKFSSAELPGLKD